MRLLPLILLAACATQPVRQTLDVLQRVEHVDVAGREPMIVEHPDGTLFVAGYGAETPTLWKSVDRGASWNRVAVGSAEDGAIGNSDVDLAVARDGTLYFMNMLYDRVAFEGRQITIAVSTDTGATWRWTTLSKNRHDDRPWVDVAPDGMAHAIWNDGSGVQHVVSTDRGATWSAPRRVHDHGGSSFLVVGPRGELAVRITPASASGNKFDEGVELIAVSTDAGASWQKHPAPGVRDWSAEFGKPGATPRWVEPLAWDATGALYSLWTDQQGVRLARSRDRGAQWQTSLLTESHAQAFFPYLIARGRGELAATWFTSADPEGKDLHWHLARIDVGDRPHMTLAPPQAIELTRGEYLPVAFLPNRTLGVATPIRGGFTWWVFGSKP
jgi:hypothetical protein